jgi:PAS domain S-box-containing protein
LRTRKVAILDTSGEPQWLLGVSEDETDRRRSEETIGAANAFLNAVLDNLPAIVFCKDTPGLRYILVNRAGEQFTGRSREDLLGHTDLELVPPELAERRTAEDREILETGRPKTKVEDIPSTAGMRRVRTTKLAVAGPDGVTRIVHGILQDETESHRAGLACATRSGHGRRLHPRQERPGGAAQFRFLEIHYLRRCCRWRAARSRRTSRRADGSYRRPHRHHRPEGSRDTAGGYDRDQGLSCATPGPDLMSNARIREMFPASGQGCSGRP